MEKKELDLLGQDLKKLLKNIIDEKTLQTKTHVGKVEDNADPLQEGRCKVRVYGMHSDNIPTDDLPWAVQDNTFLGSTKGSFIVPPVDALVNVIFQDDDIYNPRYTTKVISDSNKVSNSLKAISSDNSPDTMVFFELDNGEFFKINRKTGETQYHHSSGMDIIVQDNGDVSISTTNASSGNITINTPNNISVNAGGNADIIADGNVSVKSTLGFINLGDGVTPVNNLPACLVTGAPHFTPSSVAPGKGINVSA